MEIDQKKKAHNIIIVINIFLLSLMVIFSSDNIVNAVDTNNTSEFIVRVVPIIIVLGALISMVVIRLNIGKEMKE